MEGPRSSVGGGNPLPFRAPVLQAGCEAAEKAIIAVAATLIRLSD
jgi:hypothetical protein